MAVMEVELNDQEVVAKALTEPSFFGGIVTRYQNKLARYIGRLGIKTQEDKEDVLQEIFIKVYKNLNNYDPSMSFSAWIYRIAHNESISWYRKVKARPEGHLVADSETILENVSNQNKNIDKIFDESINARVLLEALDELPDKYRQPIILRFFENLEYEEISDVLQVPVGTVGTLIYRAKDKLKTLLDTKKLTL